MLELESILTVIVNALIFCLCIGVLMTIYTWVSNIFETSTPIIVEGALEKDKKPKVKEEDIVQNI